MAFKKKKAAKKVVKKLTSTQESKAAVVVKKAPATAKCTCGADRPLVGMCTNCGALN